MLVLSRQKNQTIMIGDKIEITVVDIRGEKVRLGITAPPEIPVHRKEVYEAIQAENREASKVRLEDVTNVPGDAKGKARRDKEKPVQGEQEPESREHRPGKKNSSEE